MCLEEMLCCDIPEGAIYFGETRHREKVLFTPLLRQEVKDCTEEMHTLFKKRHTPKVKPTKACNACSLKEICLPKIMKITSVKTYVTKCLEE